MTTGTPASTDTTSENNTMSSANSEFEQQQDTCRPSTSTRSSYSGYLASLLHNLSDSETEVDDDDDGVSNRRRQLDLTTSSSSDEVISGGK